MMPNIEAKNVRHDIDLRQNTMSIHSTGRKKSTCCLHSSSRGQL